MRALRKSCGLEPSLLQHLPGPSVGCQLDGVTTIYWKGHLVPVLQEKCGGDSHSFDEFAEQYAKEKAAQRAELYRKLAVKRTEQHAQLQKWCQQASVDLDNAASMSKTYREQCDMAKLLTHKRFAKILYTNRLEIQHAEDHVLAFKREREKQATDSQNPLRGEPNLSMHALWHAVFATRVIGLGPNLQCT